MLQESKPDANKAPEVVTAVHYGDLTSAERKKLTSDLNEIKKGDSAIVSAEAALCDIYIQRGRYIAHWRERLIDEDFETHVAGKLNRSQRTLEAWEHAAVCFDRLHQIAKDKRRNEPLHLSLNLRLMGEIARMKMEQLEPALPLIFGGKGSAEVEDVLFPDAAAKAKSEAAAKKTTKAERERAAATAKREAAAAKRHADAEARKAKKKEAADAKKKATDLKKAARQAQKDAALAAKEKKEADKKLKAQEKAARGNEANAQVEVDKAAAAKAGEAETAATATAAEKAQVAADAQAAADKAEAERKAEIERVRAEVAKREDEIKAKIARAAEEKKIRDSHIQELRSLLDKSPARLRWLIGTVIFEEYGDALLSLAREYASILPRLEKEAEIAAEIAAEAAAPVEAVKEDAAA
jgi:hypothetical protein